MSNHTDHDLHKELEDVARKSRSNARANYFAGYTVAGLVIATSLLATISAMSKNAPETTAIVAAIPAVLTAISATFKFDGKSSWHWRKTKRVDALLRSIRDENASIPEVSRAFSKLETEMDMEDGVFTFGSK